MRVRGVGGMLGGRGDVMMRGNDAGISGCGVVLGGAASPKGYVAKVAPLMVDAGKGGRRKEGEDAWGRGGFDDEGE